MTIILSQTDIAGQWRIGLVYLWLGHAINGTSGLFGRWAKYGACGR